MHFRLTIGLIMMGNSTRSAGRWWFVMWLCGACVVFGIIITLTQQHSIILLPSNSPGELFYKQFSSIEATDEFTYRWSRADASIRIPAPRNGWHIASLRIANLLPQSASIRTDTVVNPGGYAVTVSLGPMERRSVTLLSRPAQPWQMDWQMSLQTPGVKYGEGKRIVGIAVRDAAFRTTLQGVWVQPIYLVYLLVPVCFLWIIARYIGIGLSSLPSAIVITGALVVATLWRAPIAWPIAIYWISVWLAAGLCMATALRVLQMWPVRPIERAVVFLSLCIAVGPLALQIMQIYGIPLPHDLLSFSTPTSLIPIIASTAVLLVLSLHRHGWRLPAQSTMNRWGATMMVFAITIRIIQTAWINDDAKITLRTVMNALNGYGLTFNLAERVQAYTHTGWFFVLLFSSWLSGNIYVATFVVSIVCSTLTILLIVRWVAHKHWGIWIGLTALFLSKAYIDYSTSGLENPLTNLLITIAIILGDGIVFRKKDHLLPWFLAGIGMVFLNRPDALVLLAPLTAYILWTQRGSLSRVLTAITLGAVPVVVWTIFSLWYYGFPLPNTAYAKVGSGIRQAELLLQGAQYVGQTLLHDPVTLVVIALTLLLCLRARRYEQALALGIVAQIASIVLVGGDFMEGRFFATALLVAVIVLSRIPIPTTVALGMLLIVIGIGAIGFTAPLRTSFDDVKAGIADERGIYMKRYGLFSADPRTFQQPDWVLTKTRIDVRCGGIGQAGLNYGPSPHILDTCALTDPLLSKIPSRFQPTWRIGHFFRMLPTMYVESVTNNRNMLVDPSTRVYYEAIRTVTRGPLDDPQRWMVIAKLNLGLIPRPDEGIYRTMCIP